ncbi:MAG: multidrug effflux MFS transporter [Pseudomonadota bacterium]|nr:multidrug effflux MFS transporter [Pseudomonadota bacterium]
MAAIAALPPLAVDMYLPAMPQIATSLGADIATIQNSLSVFLLGFGMGMLCFGPFSDRFGRRPMALIGLAGFMLASLLVTLSPSAAMFLAFRFVQGFVGSAATVNVPAMIRDCYGKDTAKGMSTVMMIMLIAPLVAPMLGSFTLIVASWRGIFAALTLYAAILVVLTWWRLPETRPALAPGERRTLFGNYRIILGNRRVWLDLLTYIMFALAFFTFLTAASFLYITWYGASETEFGFLFAVTALSLIAANFINVRVVTKVGTRRMMHRGLGFALLSALVLTFVETAGFGSLYAMVAGFFCITGGLGIAWVNADALVVIEFPQQASSASAVIGTLRFGVGSLAGPLLALTYNGTSSPAIILITSCLAGAGILQMLRRKQVPAT